MTIDHILVILPYRISQEGVMNVGLSDHQLIYCTRKISRVKTGSMVLVISLWINILYKNREPTLWFWKGIGRCAWRFYFRTFVPYLCQQHASGFKIKFIFICRWLMSHVSWNWKTIKQEFWKCLQLVCG